MNAHEHLTLEQLLERVERTGDGGNEQQPVVLEEGYCVQCDEELKEWRQFAAAVQEATPMVTPSPALLPAIQARLKPRPRQRRELRWRLAVLGAAAVAVALLALAGSPGHFLNLYQAGHPAPPTAVSSLCPAQSCAGEGGHSTFSTYGLSRARALALAESDFHVPATSLEVRYVTWGELWYRYRQVQEHSPLGAPAEPVWAILSTSETQRGVTYPWGLLVLDAGTGSQHLFLNGSGPAPAGFSSLPSAPPAPSS